jgi:uncharacterized protein
MSNRTSGLCTADLQGEWIMIIDGHTHLFPKEIRANKESYFAEEPEFRYLYEQPDEVMVGMEELIQAMDENGVDISIASSFPWRNLDTARRSNDYILEAVHRYPERIWGLACIDVRSPGADKELVRALDAGMKGIGELAFYLEISPNGLLEIMAPVMEVIRGTHVPLLFHANENVGHTYPGKSDMRLKTLYHFLKAMPEAKVVLAHWGGGLFFYELMKKEVQEVLRNVYYDTAASPYLYHSGIYEIALRICGENKVIFGSDYPLIQPKRYFREMEEAGLTIEQMRKICGENIKALFDKSKIV